MAYDKSNRPEGGFKRRGGGRRRKKVCVFCGKENNEIDYKDVAKLRKYISETVSYTHLVFQLGNRIYPSDRGRV